MPALQPGLQEEVRHGGALQDGPRDAVQALRVRRLLVRDGQEASARKAHPDGAHERGAQQVQKSEVNVLKVFFF